MAAAGCGSASASAKSADELGTAPTSPHDPLATLTCPSFAVQLLQLQSSGGQSTSLMDREADRPVQVRPVPKSPYQLPNS